MQYCNIVFIQEPDGMVTKFFENEIDSEEMVDYLAQWDFGGESEHSLNLTNDEPWGTDDDCENVGDYILSYNTRLWYVGLVRMVKKDS